MKLQPELNLERIKQQLLDRIDDEAGQLILKIAPPSLASVHARKELEATNWDDKGANTGFIAAEAAALKKDAAILAQEILAKAEDTRVQLIALDGKRVVVKQRIRDATSLPDAVQAVRNWRD